MSTPNPECVHSETPDHSEAADVLLRQEPDDEEEDEDNGKHKDDDDDDDEDESGDGYSE
jgi:hypothetical protein